MFDLVLSSNYIKYPCLINIKHFISILKSDIRLSNYFNVFLVSVLTIRSVKILRTCPNNSVDVISAEE